jgi:Ca2+-binding RTX toxin-like protein
VPGCPTGGLLEGTDERNNLAGEVGEDEVHGLGAADNLWGGFGIDVMYGGPGDDFLTGSTVNEAGHDADLLEKVCSSQGLPFGP